MKKITLLKSFLLLCALIVGSNCGWAQVTLWSEDFSSYSASDVPTGGTYLYACENGKGEGAGNTYISNQNLAEGASAPELFIGKKGSGEGEVAGASFTAVVPLNYIEGTLTLTYKQNAYGLKVTMTAGAVSSTQTKSTKAQQTLTLSGVTASMTSVTIVFEASSTSNVRLDDIMLTGYRAVTWESTSKGIDIVTHALTGIGTGNGYTEFSGKSSNSTAVYAGKANKNDNNYIQLVNTQATGAGIVTTASGGKARKIVVDWNSSTTSGRSVQIYGKNTLYEGSADLFNDDKKGTLIGSIVCGTSTELTINDDYEYIGIKAVGGALYMNSVTIYWEGDAVSLSDASDYSPEAKSYAKVTLNRSFVAGWNGIVLPFDLTTDVKTALGASDVRTLGSATKVGDVVTLNFAAVDVASNPVAAGTPVLVKLDEALASGDVILNGVEIKEDALTTVAKTVDGNTFTLTGTYNSTNLATSEVYLVSNNTFYHKAKDVALTAKPFRAYIVQTAVSGARALNVNFDLEGGETTAISEVRSQKADVRGEYFNLNGQRVAQPAKGLYIVNGKKVVIK